MKHLRVKNFFQFESKGQLDVQEDYGLVQIEKGIFTVADGFGGYGLGDQAAKTACDSVIRFLEKDAPRLRDRFNFVVYPCIAPWAYEYDQRWNWQAEDPNRLFSRGENFKKIEECQHFMNSIEHGNVKFDCAIDLHETSNRDIKLRQMRAARFGTPLAADFREIPQGYYLTLSKADTDMGDFRQVMFGRNIIDEVQWVSPIAPEEEVMGKKNLGGIILSPKAEGLMRTYLHDHARFVAVTEAYPNHPEMTPAKTVRAQLASIHGALKSVHAPW